MTVYLQFFSCIPLKECSHLCFLTNVYLRGGGAAHYSIFTNFLTFLGMRHKYEARQITLLLLIFLLIVKKEFPSNNMKMECVNCGEKNSLVLFSDCFG